MYSGTRLLRAKSVRTRRKAAHHTPSLVIGLTGSVAMGKSTVAAFFRHLGIPVFDADQVVHLLLGPKGKALKAVAARFPGTVSTKGADRKAIGAKVFANPAALKDLEAIIHPLVREDRERFLQRAGLARHPIVVLDIPLLFEGQTHAICDLVIVVSAPSFLQRQRALARPGMTAARLESILSRQWSDQKKRAAADVVIPSGLGKRETLRRLKQTLKLVKARRRT